MAVDCAKELRKHNVAFVSLWPGVVQTEMINHFLKSKTYENNREVVCFLLCVAFSDYFVINDEFKAHLSFTGHPAIVK